MAPDPQPKTVSPAGSETILSVTDVRAGYGKREVLNGVSLHVRKGEVVALLGHNGAGKTTLLKTIFGTMKPRGGEIRFFGKDCRNRSYAENVVAGMSFSPAEAAVFPDLTVGDNLELGGFTVPDGALKKERIARIFEIYPILEERMGQLAGTLSGGEQRMLSMGVALMSGPSLMLLDEPSLGLTPALAQHVLEMVKDLAEKDGMSVLVVEQNVRAALKVSSRAYFIRTGLIILEEPSDVALARGHWWDLF